MSRIWSTMDMGKRSLMNSQTALQTVSHNISNKNTEGFSRQRVETQATEPTGLGQLRIGNGARTTTVSRTNNPFIEKQIEQETNQMGLKSSRSEMLARVEQVFNEQLNTGLNKFVGDFFNAYREMSNSPESLSVRNLVKESADFMAKDFQRVHSQLTKIQGEADYEITAEVAQINSITREVAQINEKIQSTEMAGVKANDERDRRDLLLKQLSEKANIKYGESKDGVLTITLGTSAVLVSGSQQRDIFVSATAKREGKKEGNVDIFYKSSDSGTPVNVSGQIKGGRLGGLLEVRDQFVNQTIKNLDEMAYTLAKTVNDAHSQGYDRFNNRGQNFFAMPTQIDGAAEQMRLSDRVQQNAGFIVAAADPNSPADNRVANVISSLQYQKALAGGESTFDDFYANIVGTVGVSANRANSEIESQKGIVDQLKNIRESISGVSLDEETTKMIEYQKTFDASARLIRTADQMLETVLNLKPL